MLLVIFIGSCCACIYLYSFFYHYFQVSLYYLLNTVDALKMPSADSCVDVIKSNSTRQLAYAIQNYSKVHLSFNFFHANAKSFSFMILSIATLP